MPSPFSVVAVATTVMDSTPAAATREAAVWQQEPQQGAVERGWLLWAADALVVAAGKREIVASWEEAGGGDQARVPTKALRRALQL